MKTCNVARDLMPLYAEGLANEDSAALIERHVAECADCKRYWSSVLQDYVREDEQEEQRINRLVAQVSSYQNRIKLTGVLAAMLLSSVMTGAQVQFLYTLPLLFWTPFFCRLFYDKSWPIILSSAVFGVVGGWLGNQGPSYIPFFAMISLGAAGIGVAMAMLVKRALSESRRGVKTALIIPAAAVLAACSMAYFSSFGNPAGYLIAMTKSKAYVSETYEDGTLTFAGVGYNFKNHRHYGKFEYILNGTSQVGSIEILPDGQVIDQYKQLLDWQFSEERSDEMRAWIAASVDYKPVVITAGTGQELHITRDELDESYHHLSYDQDRRDKAAALRRSEAAKLDYVITFGEFADEPEMVPPDELQAKADAIREVLQANDVPYHSIEIVALDPDGNTQRLRIDR